MWIRCGDLGPKTQGSRFFIRHDRHLCSDGYYLIL